MSENLNLQTVDTVDTRPFRKLVMTIGELPTSFVESMTYYELLAWFTNYLETVIIPTVNNNAECVEELQTNFTKLKNDTETEINNFEAATSQEISQFETNLTALFNQLKDYVDNYFDNLDVQEEIDNKLDAMVEAGTLQEIIADYLNSKAVFGYDNVASMKTSTNLIAGSYARTLGYYSANDGGSALYKIREITNDDVVDETFIYEMETADNLIAELIIDPSMNVKQFGIKADGVTDNSSKLATVLGKCDSLFFPNGQYYFGTRVDVTDCSSILGQDKGKTIIKAPNGFIYWTNSKSKTITNMHINGVEVNNVNNNIGIEGGLSFGKIENVKISNYYIGFKPLNGTWMDTFQDINFVTCAYGISNSSLTTFNNCTLSGVTFQNLTETCFDVMGSTIKMSECNFEDCNICISKAPTLMNITSCFFEGNVRILNITSGGLASYFVIEKSRLLPTNTEALANGWLACLPTVSSVDATTAVLEIKDCEIDNRTKDTIKPFAFQGTYNQTYWGVSIGNNSFKNIKTTNQYNIYYDDLFDTTNCTNYGTEANPTQFYSVLPMYAWQGITWLRSSLGNMQGAHRHNYYLQMIGKYSVTKTGGDITLTPPKKYFGVPSQSDFPVTILFTDGTMDYGKMTITADDITVTPINYNGRTTSKIIFDNIYSRRFAQYW